MPINKPAALATAVFLAFSNATVAEQLTDVDVLGCWQSEMQTVPRQGTFHIGFCFLKKGQISGGEIHGVSGSSIEDRWQRLDRRRVLIGGHICILKLSRDGAAMLISGCPRYARHWLKTDPETVLGPSP